MCNIHLGIHQMHSSRHSSNRIYIVYPIFPGKNKKIEYEKLFFLHNSDCWWRPMYRCRSPLVRLKNHMMCTDIFCDMAYNQQTNRIKLWFVRRHARHGGVEANGGTLNLSRMATCLQMRGDHAMMVGDEWNAIRSLVACNCHLHSVRASRASCLSSPMDPVQYLISGYALPY